MKNQNTISDEERRALNTMGSAWFVLRANWAYLNPNEVRWSQAGDDGISVRLNSFRRTAQRVLNGRRTHKALLEYVLTSSAARVGRNSLGVAAEEVFDLAREILKRNPDLDLVVPQGAL